MRELETARAVGRVLLHDVTEVTKNPDRKHSAFRRGHVITAADVPHLLRLGKRHVYVLGPEEGLVHENDAALRLAQAVAAEGISFDDPREGKVSLVAEAAGAVCVDTRALEDLNAHGEVIGVTRRSGSMVGAGERVASVRVLPLFIDADELARAESIGAAGGGLIRVAPPKCYRAGLVVTGSEVAEGLVEDAFEPVLRRKLAEFGSEVAAVAFPGDDPEDIAGALRCQLQARCDLLIATGGMSVDPDDRTPGAIRRIASEVIFQWAPVLPGCMAMLATAESPVSGERVPIVGVPACGAHHERTSLDLLLLRLALGRIPAAHDVRQWGHGGTCLECETCRFPNCSFGSV